MRKSCVLAVYSALPVAKQLKPRIMVVREDGGLIAEEFGGEKVLFVFLCLLFFRNVKQ